MKRTWVEQVMGMPASLLLRADTVAGVDDAVAAAYAELRRVDATFSTYRHDSEISRLRRGQLTRDQLSPDARGPVCRLRSWGASASSDRR